MFTVTIQRKDQVLSREVKKDSFTIGRSIDCDISLNDTHISRVHVVVSRRWNQIWIEDKNSSNGTFINGTKIVQGTPVNVVASDRIQLGKSEYILAIDLQGVEGEMAMHIDQPLPVEDEYVSPEPVVADTIAMPPPSQAPFQAEKLLHDAKRRAAQIILEGETQAEKRVQSIYAQAREAQTQAEAFHQARISEAHKEADAILSDFQQQAQSLLKNARGMAQELREEVEMYVQGLKEKAREDAENVVADATLSAEKIKTETLQQARDLAKEESELLIRNSREEADRVLEFARLQTQEQQERLIQDQATLKILAQNIAESEERLAGFTASLFSIKAEEAELSEKALSHEERINALLSSEKENLTQLRETEDARLKEIYANEEQRLTSLISSEEARLNNLRESEDCRLKEIYTQEEQRLTSLISGEESRLSQLREAEEFRLKEMYSTEEQRLTSLVSNEEANLKSLRETQKDFEEQNSILEKSLKSLQERQAKAYMDVQEIESKKIHLFKEFDSQKIFLNEKLEKEKSQMVKTEEQRLEEMRAEMGNRLQKMERDLLEDVANRKKSLVKEIHASVEREVVKLVEAKAWREVSAAIESHIGEAIDGKVANMAQSSITSEQPTDFLKKRKQENYRWAAMGIALGALVYFISAGVVDQVSGDSKPMQTMVQNEAKKKQDELEKRRFNPPQAEELKENYTDAVVYTRNFPEVYTDQQFQQKLYKNAAQYLLKTWRVDEDKSIQVLSAASALVKELAERKTKIHPDFIKEGVAKMRETETETLARMKEILGSEVRVESFRRFERNFYKEEIQRRRMAQH